MTRSALTDDLLRCAGSLFERGLPPGSSGNISVRLEDGGWLATPTNASLGRLDGGRLSQLDSTGRLICGDPPTKEWPIHAALYETRFTAGAIVHLHSTHAVAVSTLRDVHARDALPPLTPYSVIRLGRVAVVPYFAPGDPALAGAIRDLAGEHAAILLANHGPVVAARTLQDAVHAIEELEETATLTLLLRDLKPRLLTQAQIDALETQYPRH